MAEEEGIGIARPIFSYKFTPVVAYAVGHSLDECVGQRLINWNKIFSSFESFDSVWAKIR